MTGVASQETDVAAVAHSISLVLRSGHVTPGQVETLQASCKGLQYCSVGIHVKNFGTVICTDNLLKSGFIDLSLCPVHMSLSGSVISRASTFHDNLSIHRSGVPVDAARIVQRYNLKSAVCVPIKLNAVMMEDIVLASEQVLGTISFASDQSRGVTAQHRRQAEDIAAALALDFADATSNMFNNITDYVLGPMHGQPYPVTSMRPTPAPAVNPPPGCQPDDPDHGGQDPDSSAQLLASESDEASSNSDAGAAHQAPPHSALPTSSSTESAGALAARLDEQTDLLRDDLGQPPDRPTPLKGGRSHRVIAGHDTTQFEETQPPQQVNHSLDSAHQDGFDPTKACGVRNRKHRHPDLRDSGSEVEAKRSGDKNEQRSFSFGLSLSWLRRARSGDSAHEEPSTAPKPRRQQPRLSGSRKVAESQAKAASYCQRAVMLGFKDAALERQYSVWRAQQRTWVELCYSFTVLALGIAVSSSMSSSPSSNLLWCMLILQLVPLVTFALNPTWYFTQSELMHVVLNINKTAWAAWVGVPHLGRLGTPSRHLAIMWSSCLNALMISGLGELARFSTFIWVQALDFTMVAASSRLLWAMRMDAFVSLQQCASPVFASHAIVYVLTGSLVWYLDKQARHQFVQQHLSQTA